MRWISLNTSDHLKDQHIGITSPWLVGRKRGIEPRWSLVDWPKIFPASGEWPTTDWVTDWVTLNKNHRWEDKLSNRKNWKKHDWEMDIYWIYWPGWKDLKGQVKISLPGEIVTTKYWYAIDQQPSGISWSL